MSGGGEDAAAAAAQLGGRDLATEGVEMVLALEDLRVPSRTAGATERADGQALAVRVRAIGNRLYPEEATRDAEALARVLEVVATADLELPR